MVGNCTKGGLKGKLTQVNKGRVQGRLYVLTQVNEGRVQGSLYSVTQVKKDRVQVIYKLSTQVNKGRVQVRFGTRVNKDRVHHSTRKTSFQTGKLLTKYSSFYSQDTLKIQPKKPVFQVGARNIRQITAKYQVSSTTEQPRKLVFQVVTEK